MSVELHVPCPAHTQQNFSNIYYDESYVTVFKFMTLVIPRACASGVVIGLYVCRRCLWHENRQFGYLIDSQVNGSHQSLLSEQAPSA